MDKPAFAHINTHMAESATHGVEKHQVTRFEFGFLYVLGHGGLLLSAARQDQPNGLLIHGAHKATAVKAGLHRVTAALVGHTQKTHGIDDEL